MRLAAAGAPGADAVLAWVLAAAVIGSVLAVGSVHLPVLLAVAALVTAASAIALRVRAVVVRPPAPSLFLVVTTALAGYTLLQATPIPSGWLRVIAPSSADVWARALLPLGEPPNAWATISLDPGASTVEALKWLVYAGVFFSATVVASRRGAAWGLTVVFVSAAAAALTTLGHGLVGATRVFGLYKPTFAVEPWHLGPLLNSNNLSGYLNLGALCGMGLLLTRRLTMPRWLAGLGVATIVGVQVTAASRAGFVALPIGIVIFAILVRIGSKRDRARAPRPAERVLPPLVALVVAGGVILALLGGTHQMWKDLLDADLGKLDMILWAKPMIEDHAWFGIGRGAFESAFPAYRTKPGGGVFTHTECFPAQWMCEWGIPIACSALLAFAWALRPGRLGALRSSLAAGAWAGVAALLLQNLVDLGLEIPALCIGIAATLGSLWGDARRTGGAATDPLRFEAASPRARAWSAGVAAAGALLIAGAASRGWHGVTADRVALRRRLNEPDVAKDAGARDAVRRDLRAAMLRHPAEPYFPLLGAILAWQGRDQNPMPWIQRTLERAERSGRAHLLLAEILAAKGALLQALFELRLAVESEPGLVLTAARAAVRLSKDAGDLMVAVPSGQAGADMIENMLPGLDAKHEEARHLLDAEVAARDPARPGPRVREVDRLIAAIESGKSPACADLARCEEQIEQHAAAIHAGAPSKSMAAQIRGRLLVATGKPDEAEALLAAACTPKVVDLESCLQARVTAAARVRGPERVAAAAKDLFAATCSTSAACAKTATWLGDVLAARGDWGTALANYQRAVREDPTEERWLKLAEAASRSGAHGRAAKALEVVAKKRGATSDDLRRRIEKERGLAARGLVGEGP